MPEVVRGITQCIQALDRNRGWRVRIACNSIPMRCGARYACRLPSNTDACALTQVMVMNGCVWIKGTCLTRCMRVFHPHRSYTYLRFVFVILADNTFRFILRLHRDISTASIFAPRHRSFYTAQYSRTATTMYLADASSGAFLHLI